VSNKSSYQSKPRLNYETISILHLLLRARKPIAVWTCGVAGPPCRLWKLSAGRSVWRVACTKPLSVLNIALVTHYNSESWRAGIISLLQFYLPFILHYAGTVANNISAKHISKVSLSATVS
jgi:hypothetical protein